MIQTTRIEELTALELAELYALKELSPVEAAETFLRQIHRLDDQVNAWCFLDEETTLQQARASEERWRRGLELGLMDGVPVAVKDMFVTAGWPNIKGSKTSDSAPWAVDSPVVGALRQAGFVALGRTTTPELGWKGVTDSPLCGATNNPWNPSKTAGGSSGGSGAAVPLGMAPVALGTDAGGSIRIPAGFCGLVGHKPTQGRIPMWPASAFAPLAHPGPMTWTVADAALMMDVMCQPDWRDTTLPANTHSFLDALEQDVKGLRIAYCPQFGELAVDPQVAACVEKAVKIFELLGAQVEVVAAPFSDPAQSFATLFYGGAANAIRDLDADQRAVMDPGLIEVVEWAQTQSLLDYTAAMNERAALTETLSRFHQTYDLLLTPTLPLTAFTTGCEVPENWPNPRWPSWTPFTYPFNLTGQPACSVPCGFDDQGLPVGLQLVGARHQDALVLAAAHAYQQAAPLTHLRPKLFGSPLDAQDT